MFEKSRIRNGAGEDAQRDVYQPDKRIEAEIGIRPVYDPARYADQSFVADGLRSEGVVSELELNASATVPFPPRWVFLLIGVICLAIDIVASIGLIALLGLENPQRVFLGIGLSFIQIALIAGLMRAFK